jgi:hypothetical protein
MRRSLAVMGLVVSVTCVLILAGRAIWLDGWSSGRSRGYIDGAEVACMRFIEFLGSRDPNRVYIGSLHVDGPNNCIKDCLFITFDGDRPCIDLEDRAIDCSIIATIDCETWVF